MTHLLDALKTYITPERIASAAQLLDENENGISRAIGGLAPTILAGLQEKSPDMHTITRLFNTISQFDAGVLDHPDALIGSGNLAHHDPKDISGQLLGTIFGSKIPAITHAIAAFSGVKQSSASSLLGLAGPVVFGLLSKKIKTEGLNLSGFTHLLLDERNYILQLMPPGVHSALGLPGLSAGAASTSASDHEPATGTSWLMPLLLLLGLGAGIVYCMKYCN